MARMRATGNSALHLLALICALASGCGEIPVIAEGKYFELASDRDEELCDGTVEQIDDYLAGVAALLGETLPDRRFVRIEWRDVGELDASTMERLAQDVIVTSDPFDPHELVHAVHLQVWPRSHRLLMEGLATMIGTRGALRSEPWPEGKAVESVLGDWDGDYAAALFIVSQVVKEHGMAGLEELWRAVPIDATAAEFAMIYEARFDQPIERLVEPEMVGPVPNKRFSCFHELCLGTVQTPSADGAWEAMGPSSCADANAIGPRLLAGEETVWTQQVVELPADSSFVSLVGGSGAVVRRCGFGCNTVVHDAKVEPGTMVDLQLSAGSYVVEVGEIADEVGVAEPARLTFRPVQ